MRTVTITGDRQSGKTELLINQAVRDAMNGKRVLYFAKHVTTARNTMHLADQRLPRATWGTPRTSRTYTTRGQERITLDNGGSIHFMCASKLNGRGFAADTVILDEYDHYTNSEDILASVAPCLATSSDPHMYITHCTNTQ